MAVNHHILLQRAALNLLEEDIPAVDDGGPTVRDELPVSEVEKAATESARSDDPFQLLQQLAALRDQGILTDDEFQSKKAQILGRL